MMCCVCVFCVRAERWSWCDVCVCFVCEWREMVWCVCVCICYVLCVMCCVCVCVTCVCVCACDVVCAVCDVFRCDMDGVCVCFVLSSGDATAKLVISSPLEAHKSSTLCLAMCGVDVDFDNPTFASLEVHAFHTTTIHTQHL